MQASSACLRGNRSRGRSGAGRAAVGPLGTRDVRSTAAIFTLAALEEMSLKEASAASGQSIGAHQGGDPPRYGHITPGTDWRSVMTKTDDFIEQLARDVRPVAPLQRPWLRAVTWMLGALVYVGVLTLLMTSSRGVTFNTTDWRFLFPQIAAILVSAAAAAAAFASVIPGTSRRVLLWPEGRHRSDRWHSVAVVRRPTTDERRNNVDPAVCRVGPAGKYRNQRASAQPPSAQRRWPHFATSRWVGKTRRKSRKQQARAKAAP